MVRVSTVIRDDEFEASGIARGSADDWAWYVVDPVRHPLYAWRRRARRTYATSATELGAAVFTNGPMMGRRHVIGGKVTRRSVPVDLTVSSLTGAAAGYALSPRKPLSRLRLAVTGAGFASGVAAGCIRACTGWESCGAVLSAASSIFESKSFDDEGPRHAWLGRTGMDFGSYAISDGDLPCSVIEGVGGLIRLVRDHRILTTAVDGPIVDRDFRELAHKQGVVAWGLAPVDSSEGQGVLVVLGSADADASDAAKRLCDMGVRDAVATDQRRSIMLGHGAQHILPPPPLPRQLMQTYGLYCA